MRTDRTLAALVVVLTCVAISPARAEDAPPPAPTASDGAWSHTRFTVALPAEVTVVGLTYGVRPEVLYRFGDRGAVSRLRLAVGFLDGPDQLFIPLSLGYRAVLRQAHRIRPEVGAGVELQHRLVSDFPAVRQYGVYVEGGVGVAVDDRLSLGLVVAIDVMLYGGPGLGLGPRVFASWQL
ncbi:MAG: hypothetical protein NT062_13490 [Proteobacteria bacterium]|nr:hypothetical protein [Pseudomonadota bacterium]